MDKFVELVELKGGEVVAVGPFHKSETGQDFAALINSYDSPVDVETGRGGVRLLTVDAFARELGVSPAKLKPRN